MANYPPRGPLWDPYDQPIAAGVENLPSGDPLDPPKSALAERIREQETNAEIVAARYMMALEAIFSVASVGGDHSIICDIAKSAVNPELGE